LTKFTEATYNREQYDALTPEQQRVLYGQVLYLNDTYQVAVRHAEVLKDWPEMLHLSIKRIDKEPIHDWRDLQLIKNELVGPEHEALELYPAESRLVDAANQYHLWVFVQKGQMVPFGFTERLVMDYDETSTQVPNAKQRPFNKS
jgi:hypothetical protein